MPPDNEFCYSVYLHIFPNEKVYVGLTSKNPESRWCENGRGYERQPKIYGAIKKYGWENVGHFVLLDHLTKEEAEFLETEMIDAYGSADRRFGYNIQLGGGVHGRHSEDTKKKMRDSHLGEKNHRYGKPINSKTKKAFEAYNSTHRKRIMCVETGEVFPSVLYAAKAFNGTKGNITRAISVEGATAYGKHFVCLEVTQ